MRVNGDGTLTTVVGGLDRPTSVEIIKNTAYVVTLGGEIWTVAHIPAPPVVDRLLAVVLAPGDQPTLAPDGGVWLRVRLTDTDDDGPWDWRIAWGDGVVNTPRRVARSGEFVFLRRTPYTTPGPHTIAVTATDPTGATSRPATTTLP
jgi:hypothetical protein